jgi:hypothetical protein
MNTEERHHCEDAQQSGDTEKQVRKIPMRLSQLDPEPCANDD